MLEWFDSTATLFRERDGMVDMSGLDSGDRSRVGSSPTARIFFKGVYTGWIFFLIQVHTSEILILALSEC